MTRWHASIAALLLMAPVFAGAQTQQAGWAVDPKTGCRAWALRTGAGASFSWTGACENGFASGRGKLEWANGSRYDGEMKAGKYHGQGVFVAPNGTRYEGAWQDNKPHGQGTLTRADGVAFRGAWSNGCFRQNARWSAFMTTPKECGFE